MEIVDSLKHINRLWSNTKPIITADNHKDTVKEFLSWYYGEVNKKYYQPLTGEQRMMIELYDQFINRKEELI